MPITVVQRRAAALSAVAGVGTQTVNGTLVLGGAMTVEFDPSLFTLPGIYTIFIFNSLSIAGNAAMPAGDAAAYFQLDADSLAACGFTASKCSASVVYVGADGGPGSVLVTLRA